MLPWPGFLRLVYQSSNDNGSAILVKASIPCEIQFYENTLIVVSDTFRCLLTLCFAIFINSDCQNSDLLFNTKFSFMSSNLRDVLTFF